MKQETLIADNTRDNEEEMVDLGGVRLYQLGMNTPQDHWHTVRYTDKKKRQNAAVGCSNKCHIEETKNVFTVAQWEEKGIFYITVKKERKNSAAQDALFFKRLQSGSVSKEVEEKFYAECTPAYDPEEAARLVAAQRLAAIKTAVELLQAGKSDSCIINDFLVTEEELVCAKIQELESRVPKCVVEFMPGADDDWDKRNWTEEQIRGHQVFDWIVHWCEKGKDPIVTAEEGRINLEVVKAIYAETQEAAATKAKALRKAVIEDDKKRNPEKYLPKTKEKGEANENA